MPLLKQFSKPSLMEIQLDILQNILRPYSPANEPDLEKYLQLYMAGLDIPAVFGPPVHLLH